MKEFVEFGIQKLNIKVKPKLNERVVCYINLVSSKSGKAKRHDLIDEKGEDAGFGLHDLKNDETVYFHVVDSVQEAKAKEKAKKDQK